MVGMMRKSKWIAGTSAEMPLSDAARLAVAARLGVVWEYLSEDGAETRQDVENVHQMRVWSRRAVAALDIFWDLLPQRRARWFKKQLKRLRRAAGDARDYDVLAARLDGRAKAAGGRTLTAAIERVRASRNEAQGPIDDVCHRLRGKEFDRRAERLISRMRYIDAQPEPTFGQAAHDGLRRPIGRFFEAAAEDLSDIAALHRFRIAGKQLRYTMELFAGAFPPAFREKLYCEVEALQEKLGQINDYATAIARFERWRDEAAGVDESQQLGKLATAEKSRLAKARRTFFTWWTKDRCASMRRQFTRLTAAPSAEKASV